MRVLHRSDGGSDDVRFPRMLTASFTPETPGVADAQDCAFALERLHEDLQ